MQLVEVRRPLFGRPYPLEGGSRKRIDTTNRAEPHALFDQFVAFGRKVVLEQPHEAVDLRRRTVPVFLRKCVNREDPDAELHAQRNGVANRLDALAMSGNPWQTSCLGPPPTATTANGERVGAQ